MSIIKVVGGLLMVISLSYPGRVATKLIRLFTKDFVEIEREAERLITPEVIPQRVNRYSIII